MHRELGFDPVLTTEEAIMRVAHDTRGAGAEAGRR
jgi:hypothetical protein